MGDERLIPIHPTRNIFELYGTFRSANHGFGHFWILPDISCALKKKTFAEHF